jgi:hypothetical protein
MRTSFHHQPEAQHPNFQLSTSWQADYPIFGSLFGLKSDISPSPGWAIIGSPARRVVPERPSPPAAHLSPV